MADGNGRRMPVQQAIDVAVPVETAYNQWTQFEDWPEFMHRVTRVTMDDECTVSFATKIWGKTKEFEAQSRRSARTADQVARFAGHQPHRRGHVPRACAAVDADELNVDVEPGSLIEKAARGMRHIKRAMRADLHRFKAFIEMEELETGAWRGVIEDGELVEEHPQDYEAQRESGDGEETTARAEEDSADEDSNEPEDLADEPEAEADEDPEDVEHETDPKPTKSPRTPKASGRRRPRRKADRRVASAPVAQSPAGAQGLASVRRPAGARERRASAS